MHISDGLLPATHALTWIAVAAPFAVRSLATLEQDLRPGAAMRVPVIASAAFTLALSALKLPSVTGSCSHLTGIGFGTLTVGASRVPAVALAVLLLQALLLAHGGITTLGANVCSMGVAGSLAAGAVGWLCLRAGTSRAVRAFTMGAAGSLAPYVVTALQLGAAQAAVNGIWASTLPYLTIFGLTQLPLAIVEGIITAYAVQWLDVRDSQEALA